MKKRIGWVPYCVGGIGSDNCLGVWLNRLSTTRAGVKQTLDGPMLRHLKFKILPVFIEVPK